MDKNYFSPFGYCQPYQGTAPSFQNAQKQFNQYAYVNGIEGAKAFPMTPDTRIMLMDQNEPIFYMKASNMLGQSTITVYRFEEVQQGTQTQEPCSAPQQTPVPEFLTKDDIKPLIERIAKLEKAGNKKNESTT